MGGKLPLGCHAIPENGPVSEGGSAAYPEQMSNSVSPSDLSDTRDVRGTVVAFGSRTGKI